MEFSAFSVGFNEGGKSSCVVLLGCQVILKVFDWVLMSGLAFLHGFTGCLTTFASMFFKSLRPESPRGSGEGLYQGSTFGFVFFGSLGLRL